MVLRLMILAALGSGATGSAATGSAAISSRPIGPITQRESERESICNVDRDICKQCPSLSRMTQADCEFGEIVKTEDCNGCPLYE